MRIPRTRLLLAVAFALAACTVNVHQPRITGVENVQPSRPPIPTLQPIPRGMTVIDKTLGEVAKAPTTSVVRLPGIDDLPPSAPPPEGGELDQQSLVGSLDVEVRGPGRLAQRFRAMRSGSLTGVAVHLRAVETRTVTGRISVHEMNEDGSPGALPLARSPELTLLEAGQSSGWCRATFVTPCWISRYRPYVWVLRPDPDMAVRVIAGPEPSYPDGTGWVSGTVDGPWNRARLDFVFQTWVTASAPVADVPEDASPEP